MQYSTVLSLLWWAVELCHWQQPAPKAIVMVELVL